MFKPREISTEKEMMINPTWLDIESSTYVINAHLDTIPLILKDLMPSIALQTKFDLLFNLTIVFSYTINKREPAQLLSFWNFVASIIWLMIWNLTPGFKRCIVEFIKFLDSLSWYWFLYFRIIHQTHQFIIILTKLTGIDIDHSAT